jgi:anti-sigma28 factor (negative regulator of flagellin synthesis)
VSQLAQSLAAPDPGRIEQLRLEVQSGSYDVSAQAVAKALIDAHLSE